MKKITTLLLCIIIITAACKPKYMSTRQKTQLLNKMGWLHGMWVTQASTFLMVETWKQVNDTVLKGSSIMIMANDTVLNEKMSIETNKYTVLFKSQNLMDVNSNTATFTLSKLTAKKIIFSNPSGKLETKISYVETAPGVMNIFIEGSGKPVESFSLHNLIK